MPLSEDSRALLTLLLGRGKSYADISDLLGTDEADVRRRAGQALAEVDPSISAPSPDLTDYVLGQADPIARADIDRQLETDSDLAGDVDGLSAQLLLLFPQSEGSSKRLPKVSRSGGGSGKKAISGKAPDGKDSDDAGSSLPAIDAKQRRLIALLLAAALLAVVVILLVTGAFGGDGDENSSSDGQSGEDGTVARLLPVGESSGSGTMEFGFTDTAEYAANLRVSGMERLPKNERYQLWLAGATLGDLPLLDFNVNKEGQYEAGVPLNALFSCMIAADVFSAASVSVISRSQVKPLQDQVANRARNNRRFPKIQGDLRLNGLIAMDDASRESVLQTCQQQTS